MIRFVWACLLRATTYAIIVPSGTTSYVETHTKLGAAFLVIIIIFPLSASLFTVDPPSPLPHPPPVSVELMNTTFHHCRSPVPSCLGPSNGLSPVSTWSPCALNFFTGKLLFRSELPRSELKWRYLCPRHRYLPTQLTPVILKVVGTYNNTRYNLYQCMCVCMQLTYVL
ncbi:hypothetical protein F5X96DRAFT_295458 [Biscogniauxia mediterranea]|nr:hypothetical protein F5X96DRAFT_295458 [Biscogniauxia mediterranea]